LANKRAPRRMIVSEHFGARVGAEK
jgi:hypothetical protein